MSAAGHAMSIIPNSVRRKYGMPVTVEKLSVMLSFWVQSVARAHDMLGNNQQRISKQAGARQDTSCQLYQALLGESTAWPWQQRNWVWFWQSEWKQWQELMICWSTISKWEKNKRERGRTRHVNYTKHCYAKVRHDRDTRETECDAIILSENSDKKSWYAGQQSAKKK